MDFNKGETLYINDVQIYYVYLNSPDSEFGAEWSVHAKVSDDKAQELRDLGFNVKDGNLVKAKRKVVTGDGKQQAPPKVVGLDGKTKFDGYVGAGSNVNLEVWCKKYKISNHVSMFLNAVQVLEAVDAEAEADNSPSTTGFGDLS